MTEDMLSLTAAGPALLRLGDLLVDAEAEARSLYELRRAGLARGPVSGLPLLDRELNGAMDPGLHMLHGAPGTGKSALSLQVATSCACPALLVTLEMRPMVLLRRLAARVTETYLGRFSSGELPPDRALNLYRRAVAAAPGLAILDGTREPVSLADITRAAELVRGEHPYLLVVVDSLHSYADAQAGASADAEYDRLNTALVGLRALSARLVCPVLVVCERNRVSMAKGGMSAGAGTRKIEYGAETVLDLEVAEDAKPDARGDTQVALKLAKNRAGQAGRTIRLLFNGALQRFREDVQ